MNYLQCKFYKVSSTGAICNNHEQIGTFQAQCIKECAYIGTQIKKKPDEKEKHIELKDLESNIEGYLWNAQERYESAILKYGIFRDKYIELKVEYERKLGIEIKDLKSIDGKVTSVKDMAKANCSKDMKEMFKAETQYKYYNKLVDGLNERIQTIKYLGRIKFGNLLNK